MLKLQFDFYKIKYITSFSCLDKDISCRNQQENLKILIPNQAKSNKNTIDKKIKI